MSIAPDIKSIRILQKDGRLCSSPQSIIEQLRCTDFYKFLNVDCFE